MRVIGLVALFFVFTVSLVHAQETGGSFESEDWGSSSGSSDWGSSSGSSDWGSSSGSSDWGSSSSSYPSTDYDTSSSPSYSPATADDAGLIFILVMIALFVFVPLFVAYVGNQVRRTSSQRVYGADYVPVIGPRSTAGLVDVSALQLAIDWRARRFVQAELAKLARARAGPLSTGCRPCSRRRPRRSRR